MFDRKERIGIGALIQWSGGLTCDRTDHRNRGALWQTGWVKKRFSNSQESTFRSKTVFCEGLVVFRRELQHFHFSSPSRQFGSYDGPTDHDRSSDILAGCLFQVRETDGGIDLFFKPNRNTEQLSITLDLMEGLGTCGEDDDCAKQPRVHNQTRHGASPQLEVIRQPAQNMLGSVISTKPAQVAECIIKLECGARVFVLSKQGDRRRDECP